MIKLGPIVNKILEVSSNSRSINAGAEGEPDTGYVQAGEMRVLGIDDNKPEPWFTRGHYEQLSFPKGDYVYGRGKGKDTESQRLVVVKKIVNTGEKYENYEEDIASWDKYGGEDYSLDYDVSQIDQMIKDQV